MAQSIRPDLQELLADIMANQDYLRPQSVDAAIDPYTGNSALQSNTAGTSAANPGFGSTPFERLFGIGFANRNQKPQPGRVIAKPLLLSDKQSSSAAIGGSTAKDRLGRNIGVGKKKIGLNRNPITIMPVSGGNNMFLPLV